MRARLANRTRLANRVRDWPNARAIYQTLRNWSNAACLTNWSNALRDCPNAQNGQMRLTSTLDVIRRPGKWQLQL